VTDAGSALVNSAIPFTARSPLKQRAGELADRVLTRLAPWLVTPARPVPRHPRILVIRCDHIGDAVMATAALQPIADAMEPSQLDVLAGPWGREIFATHPAVHEVLTVETPWWLAARGAGVGRRFRAWLALPAVVRRLRSRQYDFVFELRGDLRQILLFGALSGAPRRIASDRTGGRALLTHAVPHDDSRHEVERLASLLASVGVTRIARPVLRPPERVRASLADQLPPVPFVVVAGRGTEPNRAWPAEHVAAVSRQLERRQIPVVLVGALRDRRYARDVAAAGGAVLDLTGQTSLQELMYVLARAAVAVCTDSGPMHIAAAVGTPVIALFGPGDPRHSRPWGGNVMLLTSGAPCGCVHPWCDRVVDRSAPGACMAETSPSTVESAVLQALGIGG
jgi:ADP-heptose:LPS heptosyltransferase